MGVSVWTIGSMRKKVYHALNVNAKSIHALAYSNSAKSLVMYTSGPAFAFLEIDVETGQVLKQTNDVADSEHGIRVLSVDLQGDVVIAGDRMLKVLRPESNGVRVLLPNLHGQPLGSYTCAAMLPDGRRVIGTASGDVLILRRTEVVSSFTPFRDLPVNVPAVSTFGVTALLCHGDTLTVAMEGGILCVYKLNLPGAEGQAEDEEAETGARENAGEAGNPVFVRAITLTAACDRYRDVDSASSFQLSAMESYLLEEEDDTEVSFRPKVTELALSIRVTSLVPRKAGSVFALVNGDALKTVFSVELEPKPVDVVQATLEEGQKKKGGEKDGNILNDVAVPKSKRFEISPVLPNAHQDRVTGVDVCHNKAIVATCSTDRSVKVWDFGHGTLSARARFAELPMCVALHPDGMRLAVGFRNKLRLCRVLGDVVVSEQEMQIKNTRSVKYSTTGSLLAVAADSVIHILGVNGNTVCDLKGHNGRVMGLTFLPYGGMPDGALASCASDGAVYVFSIAHCRRLGECVLKGTQHVAIIPAKGLSDCAVSPGEKPPLPPLLVLSADGLIHRIGGEGLIGSCSVHVPGKPVSLTIDHRTGRYLFATDTGSVGLLPVDLMAPKEDEEEAESVAVDDMETRTPQAGIQSISVVADGLTSLLGAGSVCRVLPHSAGLVVAGSEGGVFVGGIPAIGLSLSSADIPSPGQITGRYNSLVTCTQDFLVKEQRDLVDLRAKLNEVRLQAAYDMQIESSKHQQATALLKSKHDTSAAKHQSALLRAQQQSEDTEVTFSRRIAEMESDHMRALTALEQQYQQRVLAAAEREQGLLAKVERLNQQQEATRQELAATHSHLMSEQQQSAERKEAELRAKMQRLTDEKTNIAREFAEVRRQSEEDVDLEIEELKARYQKRIDEIVQEAQVIQAENGLIRNKFATLEKTILTQKGNLASAKASIQSLDGIVASLKRDIQAAHSEISERDETISDRERRIYELKRKNKELEKFKFVLDYKIKELKRQIEPRELEVADLREQIREMDIELERYHKTNTALEIAANEVKMLADSLNKQLGQTKRKLLDSNTRIGRMESDIASLAQHLQEPRKLKAAARAIYLRYAPEHQK
ncbi:hypothetical protein KIPB_001434, partial [Kipferlia bialata]|eukprot:g1434.t1